MRTTAKGSFSLRHSLGILVVLSYLVVSTSGSIRHANEADELQRLARRESAFRSFTNHGGYSVMERHQSDQSHEFADPSDMADSDFDRQRKRLAKLLGRLLARHWLRRQAELQDRPPSATKPKQS